MDRRAFLLGALAAPIAAPAIAKAAAEPATGGIVRAIRPMVIGEAGAEMVIPKGFIEAVSQATGVPQRMLLGEVRNIRITSHGVEGDVKMFEGGAQVVEISEGRTIDVTVPLSREVTRTPEI